MNSEQTETVRVWPPGVRHRGPCQEASATGGHRWGGRCGVSCDIDNFDGRTAKMPWPLTYVLRGRAVTDALCVEFWQDCDARRGTPQQ